MRSSPIDRAGGVLLGLFISLGGLGERRFTIKEPAQKRRSTHIVQAVPIAVTGVDALGQPFKERTTTVMVNCHGCKYQSKHRSEFDGFAGNSTARGDANRRGRCRGASCGHSASFFQIGLEFEVPGNFWGIAFPPRSWASRRRQRSNKRQSLRRRIRLRVFGRLALRA